jgi:hypothetical protein
MGRDIKRVPVDFEWPEGKIWPGYKTYYDHCPCEIYKAYPGHEDADLSDDSNVGCQLSHTDRCPYFTGVPSGEGWQVWENVTEGSPVSPVFATKGELVDWLTKNGTGGMFDQPLSQEAAVAFVDAGWVMSGAICHGQMMNGAEALKDFLTLACDKED